MYISLTIRDAHSIETVVAAINEAPICEGMEGIEFTAEQLAGQYAAAAQIESGYPVDKAALEAHLDYLQESGARFDYPAAIAQGLAVAEALKDE